MNSSPLPPHLLPVLWFQPQRRPKRCSVCRRPSSIWISGRLFFLTSSKHAGFPLFSFVQLLPAAAGGPAVSHGDAWSTPELVSAGVCLREAHLNSGADQARGGQEVNQEDFMSASEQQENALMWNESNSETLERRLRIVKRRLL